MKPLYVVVGVIAVSALVWLSASAKEEAGDATDRVGDVELIIACKHPRSEGCRTLAVKAVSACVKFAPCRRALLADSEREVKQRIHKALGALEGGDANGSPSKSSGSG